MRTVQNQIAKDRDVQAAAVGKRQTAKKQQTRHSILQSWTTSVKGFGHAVKNERNVGLVLAFMVLAIIISALLRITATEWAIVVLCCGLVLTCELLNTAIEAVTDLACDNEIHPLAKIAKDTAAAATLVTSATSLVIAAIIFIPHIISQ